MTYGAVAAKVRALKGTLLTDDELRQLCLCSSLDEFAALLRRLPGCADAVAALPASGQTAEQLRDALELQWQEQLKRLYLFAGAGDRQYLSFAVWGAELKAVLSALRRLRSPGSAEPEPVSEFIKAKSGADLDAVATCGDYAGLLTAVKGSIFFPVLEKLPVDPETGLPDYAAADILLENQLYSRAWSLLNRGQSGRGKKQLAELLGHEADLLNLTHAMRLRRFSREVTPLIPVSRKLKPETAAALVAARTDQEVQTVLDEAGFGQYFPRGPVDPEKQYRRQMETFCRRLLNSPEPNFCFVQAYLTLKALERDRLIRIVRAIDYGVDPRLALE